MNAWTTAALTADDVTGSWAGLRPLVDDAPAPGPPICPGGTPSSCRPTASSPSPAGQADDRPAPSAADTVDVVCFAARWRTPPFADPPAPSGGSGGTAHFRRLHAGDGPPAWALLAGRHGSETDLVVALCDEDASLADPMVAGMPYLRAEAVWAARHLGWLTPSDVLARRTRAPILDREATFEAAASVAALLAPELAWSEAGTSPPGCPLGRLVEEERRAAAGLPGWLRRERPAPAAPPAQGLRGLRGRASHDRCRPGRCWRCRHHQQLRQRLVTLPGRAPIPVQIDASGASLPSRLHREVPVDDGFLARLHGVCAAVDTSAQARLDAGRDWWPSRLAWAVERTVPAPPRPWPVPPLRRRSRPS